MRSSYIRFALIALLPSTVQFTAAQLYHSPAIVSFSGANLADAEALDVVDIKGAHVKFRYAGAQTGFGNPVPPGDNFFVVIPSTGTTPAAIQMGVNPQAAALLEPSGTYTLGALFTTVDQTPASTTIATVIFKKSDEPPPAIQSVVNSASLQPLLSPGALVSIFGTYLTGPTLSTTYDDTASYPTTVAATSVTFNGIAAPLLYLSPGQINAIVPFSLAGQTSVQVAVQRFARVSASVTVPLQDAAPAIFTSAQTGTGQAAILQQAANGPRFYNSSANPAHAGDYLEIFATGQGLWTPPPQSDLVFFSGRRPTTVLPVSLTIGGQPAKIVYGGTVGGVSTWGVLQVNAVVPDGLSAGNQPVVLKIAANDNTQQKVTLAVE